MSTKLLSTQTRSTQTRSTQPPATQIQPPATPPAAAGAAGAGAAAHPPTPTARPPAGLPGVDEVAGRAGQENFPVALRLLPRARRQDLMSIYGFARLVDQIGDAYPGDRLAALDWLDGQLDAALAGVEPAPALHRLVAAAAAVVAAHGLDPQPLRDLVAANRQDQLVKQYATFEDLTRYCRLSANPVGRLVLGIFGAATPERVAWSDDVCTGLQLAEHWQDVAEDAAAGRVYLPAQDRQRFGVEVSDLLACPAPCVARALLAFEVARARTFLAAGTPLVSSLRGPARLAVAGFVAGGLAALDGVAAAGFAGPSRPAPRRVAVHAVAVLRASPVAGRS